MSFITHELIIIEHPKGGIYKFLRVDSPFFDGFGEVYFSAINNGEVKGWKKHLRFTSVLTVIHGCVKFVLIDRSNDFHEFTLDAKENYRLLEIKPETIYGFQ